MKGLWRPLGVVGMLLALLIYLLLRSASPDLALEARLLRRGPVPIARLEMARECPFALLDSRRESTQ